MRLARHQPLPQWYLDEPDLIPGMEWFFKAFWELDTERKIVFGRIPASKITEYSRDSGLDEDMQIVFKDMIQELDREYLKWSKEKQDEQRRSLKNQNDVDKK